MIKSANRGFPRPQTARFSSLLIGAGLLVFVFALLQGAQVYQQYNSPFDEVDSSVDYAVGFLPVLSLEEADRASANRAPAFERWETGRHPVAINDSLLALRSSAGAPEGGTTPARGLNGAAQPEAELRGSGVPGAEAQGGAGAVAQIPERIVIPAIDVDAPIVPVGLKEIEYKLQSFQQWTAPDFYAAGWHSTSATLGMAGNTVLNGHHNAFGEIFRDLSELEIGDLIYVHSGDQVFTYSVGLSTRFDERFRPVEERLENARWILPSQDERLTIITCWPYESNTHRVVIVALPVRDHSGIID